MSSLSVTTSKRTTLLIALARGLEVAARGLEVAAARGLEVAATCTAVVPWQTVRTDAAC